MGIVVPLVGSSVFVVMAIYSIKFGSYDCLTHFVIGLATSLCYYLVVCPHCPAKQNLARAGKQDHLRWGALLSLFGRGKNRLSIR